MDRQDIDMTYRAPNIIGALILNIWTVASLTVYGAICAVIGLFSRMGAQFFCKNWMVMFLGLAGVRIEIKGRSKLDTKECYIFLCNHQSLLDIPVLYTCLHNPLVFIAKKELFWMPVVGWGMAGMGHVSIDRSSARKALTSFGKAVTRLKRERLSLVLFPEGTRSADGTLGEFKKGSFNLAMQANVRVVPVAIRGTGTLLPKKKLLVSGGTVRVDIGDPITVSGMDKTALVDKVRAEIAAMLSADHA